jgi:eukaryotic-like serine/threonine-protein kinase
MTTTLDPDTDVLRTTGAYELLAKIGAGAMGTVYKGRQWPSGPLVAIKVVLPEVVADRILLKRFEQEFLAAKRLDHPNIVRALDYQATPNHALLVMEYVEGESLGEKLEREGPMPEAAALLVIAQVAQGLHHAHQRGLIHRDVKPDNVLITPDGQAKLTDLGLAKALEATEALTCTGRGLGTPHFMAPEQFRNAKAVDVRSDVFSLGATLYIMVTGQLPFRGTGPLDTFAKMVNNDLVSPRKLAPELSKRIEHVIQKALNADPQARPASCRAFVDELLGRETAEVADRPAETDFDLWYVTYPEGHPERGWTVGTTEHVRRSLHQGLFGDPDKVRVRRTRSGPDHIALKLPEFQAPVPGHPALTGWAKDPPPTLNGPTASGSETAPPAGLVRRGVASGPCAAPAPSSTAMPSLQRCVQLVLFALVLAGALLAGWFVFLAK